MLIILMGLGVAVVGAYLRLSTLLYITVAFLAGFTAISLTTACFGVLTSHFATVTSRPNAAIISFVLLGLMPALFLFFAGRQVISRITKAEFSPLIDAILGSAYAISIYLALLQII
jgi:ABC-type nickel/cobalt efflux system permease component RcnA